MASIGKIKRLVIHHVGIVGVQFAKNPVARIRNYHKTPPKWVIKNGKKVNIGGPGFSDIAYHKVIDGQGKILDGRSESVRGSHVEGGNTGALGVCVTVHFGVEKPTTAQLSSLVELLVRWCREHKLSTSDIYGHHNVPVGTQKDECPGKNMVSKFKWIKDQVWSQLAPPKYRLSAKLKTPEIRRILARAIDNDKRLSPDEVRDLIFAVIDDGQIHTHELNDLKAISKYSKSLRGDGRRMMNRFLSQPKKFMKENLPRVQKNSSNGSVKSPEDLANQAFFKRHPERNGKPLTSSKADAPLRPRPARTFGDLRRDRGGLARFSLSFYNVRHVMFQQFMEDV